MKRILGKHVRLRLEQLEVRATPAALGGLSVAAGDFNNDGFTDLVIGAGVGQAPRVQIISGYDNQVISEYSAYDNGFTGGVNVAVGDINGDGTDDVITAPATTGAPHVKVFDGATGVLLESYFAYAPSFTGGVNLASGDVDADGKDDVITGAGIGGSPHVRVFRQGGQSTIKDFFPFNSTFRGGTYVASADLDQDGAADVVTGAGPGGGPHVRAFSGRSSTELASFFAFDPSFLGGVSVAADHLRDMPAARIITAAASGVPYVKVFSAPGIQEYSGQFVYDNAFRGGVRLATADINGDEIPDLITAPGQGGGPHVRMLDGATGVELAGFFAFKGGNPQGGFSKLRGSTNAPDADGDSLPDAIEKVFFGTTPDNFDSDGDLLPDGVEARTPGLRPTVQDDADGDYDADGLTNLDEVIFRTRLDQPDTDGDGVFDAGEVSQGSDPLNRADSTAPDPNELVELRLSVGDPSGSESERYNLVVGNVVHQAPNFGEVSTGIYKFRRGRDYPIQIVHRGTDPNYTDNPRPDYDYFAAIDSPAGSLQQAVVTIEDPSGILGEHNESQSFYAAGKQAVLRVGKVFTISPLRQSLKVAESRRPTGERIGNDSQYDDGRYPFLSADINFRLDVASIDSDLELTLALRASILIAGGGQLGQEMVSRFLAGTGADFEHQDGSVLSDAVRESTQFKDLVKQTQDGIQDMMNRQAQTGFIDPARFGGLPIRVDNPFFNDQFSFLAAVLGGTQRTDVGLIEFTADGTIAPASGTGTYRAKLRFEIYDDFGVDEKDLDTVTFGGIEFPKPLASFYVLQHERSGHRPFVNHVTVTVPIEGRFTIPPGYGKVDKVP